MQKPTDPEMLQRMTDVGDRAVAALNKLWPAGQKNPPPYVNETSKVWKRYEAAMDEVHALLKELYGTPLGERLTKKAMLDNLMGQEAPPPHLAALTEAAAAD